MASSRCPTSGHVHGNAWVVTGSRPGPSELNPSDLHVGMSGAFHPAPLRGHFNGGGAWSWLALANGTTVFWRRDVDLEGRGRELTGTRVAKMASGQ